MLILLSVVVELVCLMIVVVMLLGVGIGLLVIVVGVVIDVMLVVSLYFDVSMFVIFCCVKIGIVVFC